MPYAILHSSIIPILIINQNDLMSIVHLLVLGTTLCYLAYDYACPLYCLQPTIDTVSYPTTALTSVYLSIPTLLLPDTKAIDPTQALLLPDIKAIDPTQALLLPEIRALNSSVVATSRSNSDTTMLQTFDFPMTDRERKTDKLFVDVLRPDNANQDAWMRSVRAYCRANSMTKFLLKKHNRWRKAVDDDFEPDGFFNPVKAEPGAVKTEPLDQAEAKRGANSAEATDAMDEFEKELMGGAVVFKTPSGDDESEADGKTRFKLSVQLHRSTPHHRSKLRN